MKKLMAKQVAMCAVGMMRLMPKFVYFSFCKHKHWTDVNVVVGTHKHMHSHSSTSQSHP